MDEQQVKRSNKKFIIPLAVAVVLLAIAGGYFLLRSHHDKPQVNLVVGSQSTCQVNPKNNQLKFIIANASDIKHVSWTFTYDADVPKSQEVEGATGKVSQSIGGEKEVSGNTFDSEYELMGTCSKGICRCDTGVSSVTLDGTVTYKDGSTTPIHETKKL